jgi:hypothetical protein
MIAEEWKPVFGNDHAQKELGVILDSLQQGAR